MAMYLKFVVCFCYLLSGIGSLVLLTILFLSQDSYSKNCLVYKYNLSTSPLLNYLSDSSLCVWLEYSTAVMPTISAVLFVITCVKKSSDLTGCWVFQFICNIGALFLSTAITFILTTSMIIFCEDFHYFYDKENKSCIQAAASFDLYTKNGALLAAKILIITLAASWTMFFSWLINTLITIVHVCSSSDKKKIEFLNNKIEDMRHSLMQQELIISQRRNSYDFDPPDLHSYEHNQLLSVDVDKPLIVL